MENINLIRKIAWSFHNTTGLEWDELFQEASLYYFRALKTWDPERGQKLTTYIYRSMTCELINYVRKNKKFSENYSSLEIEKLTHVPASNDFFDSTRFFESLTKEAQEIADLVLASPKPFDCRSPRKAQERVVNILREWGWSEEKIESGLEALKLALS